MLEYLIGLILGLMLGYFICRALYSPLIDRAVAACERALDMAERNKAQLAVMQVKALTLADEVAKAQAEVAELRRGQARDARGRFLSGTH